MIVDAAGLEKGQRVIEIVDGGFHHAHKLLGRKGRARDEVVVGL